jgi:hypothetical protein
VFPKSMEKLIDLSLVLKKRQDMYNVQNFNSYIIDILMYLNKKQYSV